MKTKIFVSAILLAGLLTACEKDAPVVSAAPVETAPAETVVTAPLKPKHLPGLISMPKSD